MPRFVAVLAGQEDTVKTNLAPFFNSANARIHMRNGDWVLECAAFAECNTADEAFKAADAVLETIHQILALYIGIHSPLSIIAIVTADDYDRTIGRRIRTRKDIEIYSSSKELSVQVKNVPLGNVILEASVRDESLAEALKLVGSRPLSWPKIYDLIEYLGGENGIVAARLATREKTRRVRQTANHYRHLGASKRSPLPPDPPTLGECTAFISEVLKKWIATKC